LRRSCSGGESEVAPDMLEEFGTIALSLEDAEEYLEY
jgi:hypothetical protein